MLGVVFGDVKAVHGDRLVEHHTARAIGLARVHAPGVHAALGAGNKEGSGLMHLVQPREVHVAPVHDAKSPSFDGQDAEHLDIGHLAAADVDEGGNGAVQAQQRVHLHYRFGGAKRRPVEHTQACADIGATARRERRDHGHRAIRIRRLRPRRQDGRANAKPSIVVTNMAHAFDERIVSAPLMNYG